ncbi:carbohydrate sulfotransferase 11-like isoform X1 [Montipora capricornis]|uniref:carbohydrate sulfotransferase 11-like isoform X1 n=1 Tax=Montipora capricornis TaxID=246305 RepID=UPI0035F12254
MMNVIRNQRLLHLGATVILFLAVLSLLAWMIKTNENFIFVKQPKDDVKITKPLKHKKTSKLLREYCAQYQPKLQEKDLDFSNFIVLEKYKLVYCTVPKVACTVWKRILANLQGLHVTNGVHKNTRGRLNLLSNHTLENREKILKTYTKFMFVREPFERLLSAYRDCFHGEYKTKAPYWKDYRAFVKDVLATSRGGGYNDTLPGDVTFEQFATFLVLQWQEGALFQEHWREQYKLCHPCRVQFDFIGHYETLAQDAHQILRMTNLEKKVDFPDWNPTDTNSLMQEYYSTLSSLRLKQLQTIYKNDTKAFGYSYPRPLEMIIDKRIRENS